MKNEERLFKIRHSLAHIMAHAVLDLFPETKLAIGPPIENGFYYDFDFKEPLLQEDLERIQARMVEIITTRDLTFSGEEITRTDAEKRFVGQPYKLDILRGIPADEKVTLYKVADFVDLCRGGHIDDPKEIKADAFKLLSIAGAYWRGKETNPMLTRIYATGWTNAKELRMHLNHLAEMEKRDHRKLGKEQQLFSLHEEAGPGLVYWHPRGSVIRGVIEDSWREIHRNNGYDIVFTPHIGKSWLWETSGHLDFYKEGMYPNMEMDKADYYVKPMNCPFHIMMYNTTKHSYRELPFRWAELGTVYRYEKAGALHGLTRVRGFTQDDAHLVCTQEQVREEIGRVLKFSLDMLKMYGFEDMALYVSTKPEKSVGDDAKWEMATSALMDAVSEAGIPYEIDEGGGAFYGPKIDVKIKDALGRQWQLSTVQFDFNLPERFDMTYVDSDNTAKRPFMIHRALLGSIERFFGILIEHYAGAFPLWLAPEQVMVIPVSNTFDEYATSVYRKLKDAGYRAKIDDSSDRMNAKIRKAQGEKIPVMLIVGADEAEHSTVSVRLRGGRQTKAVAFDRFVAWLDDHITNRKNTEEDLIAEA